MKENNDSEQNGEEKKELQENPELEIKE